MKTLAQLRQYIWDFLDIEAVDLPESLLNVWAKEGFDRIIKVSRRFPFFEKQWELMSTPGSLGSPTLMPDDLESVEWLTWGGRLLEPIGYREAYDLYTDIHGNPSHSGTPQQFSVYNGQIFFWPTPTEEQVVVVHGWRAPVDWVSVAGAPDLPPEFESVLLSFMLYRAYGHQGLLTEAFNERNEFESQLAQFTGWEMESPTEQPMILGGGRSRRAGPYPLTFPIRYG